MVAIPWTQEPILICAITIVFINNKPADEIGSWTQERRSLLSFMRSGVLPYSKTVNYSKLIITNHRRQTNRLKKMEKVLLGMAFLPK